MNNTPNIAKWNFDCYFLWRIFGFFIINSISGGPTDVAYQLIAFIMLEGVFTMTKFRK